MKFENSSLNSIPIEIFSIFENLKSLDLDSQKIQKIVPNSFANAKNLKYLNLNSNDIKMLETNSFIGCHSLEELHVSGTPLGSNIEQRAFNGLPKLEKLKLCCNGMSTIKENLFDKLTNLKTIELYTNQIQFVPENIFKFNLKLESIWLQYNQISSLSPKTFSKLVNLKSLYLYHNECVNEGWSSNAFRSMVGITERLRECNKNYIFDTTGESCDKCSNKIENLESKMTDSSENFNTKFNKITHETTENLASSLSGLELKFEKTVEALQNLKKNSTN